MKSLSEKLLLSWALPVASVRQQPVYLPERAKLVIAARRQERLIAIKRTS